MPLPIDNYKPKPIKPIPYEKSEIRSQKASNKQANEYEENESMAVNSQEIIKIRDDDGQ